MSKFEIDATFVLDINKIKEEFDKELKEFDGKFEKMKKGGKRRGKIGGGFCIKHQFQYSGSDECPLCANARTTRKHRRRINRAKSRRRTFANLKIKGTSPEAQAHNDAMDGLDNAGLTPRAKAEEVRKAIGSSVALKKYSNARWWWRLFQLRYAVLELIFYTIGGGLTLSTYWSWVWFGEYMQFFLDASVPSEMRKQLRKQFERELADSQRALRRRMRDGFRELRRQNIENGMSESDADAIENRLNDYAESENPQLRLPQDSTTQNPNPSPSPSRPSLPIFKRIQSAIGEGLENFREINNQLFDGLEDGLVGSFRTLQDVKDDIGKPVTTFGDLLHELGRGFNTIGPLFLTILMISYLLRRTIPVKRDLNKWPEEPLFPFPDDPNGGPKGDGSGSGQGNAPALLTSGDVEKHGGRRRRRKKTRKKRRKTRHKSKKRKKRKRKRKTKRRKRRR